MHGPHFEARFIEYLAYRCLEPGIRWGDMFDRCRLADRVIRKDDVVRRGVAPLPVIRPGPWRKSKEPHQSRLPM